MAHRAIMPKRGLLIKNRLAVLALLFALVSGLMNSAGGDVYHDKAGDYALARPSGYLNTEGDLICHG